MGHDRPQSTTFEASTPVCIPARWAARRFPGKLLQTLPDGRSVLETTIDIAQRARLGPVLLLAADEDILAAASGWGCRIHRSSQPARNGSERIAAALEDGALGTPPPERIVNLQGDAVGASSELLAAALDALDRHPEATLGTVAVRHPGREAPGRVTVRVEDGLATDFSRRPLATADGLLLHVGIYAYRVDTLLEVAATRPTPRELEESLEQLRWLESGHRIAVTIVDGPGSLAHSIDSPEDLKLMAPTIRGTAPHERPIASGDPRRI